MKHFSGILALALCVADVSGTSEQEANALAMNPIRKVVKLLEAMQKRVTEEGEKEKAMHSKYMCYCKTNGGALSSSIAANSDKSTHLSSDIKEAEEQKVGTTEALEQAQNDRASAKAAMSEATKIREREAAAFASEKATYDSNIQAIVEAIRAIEKGKAGAFLQSGRAQVLQQVVQTKQDMLEADREDLLAFLSGGQSSDYAPASGQITGILKQMGDEMGKNLNDATAQETAAIQAHEELMTAKKREVQALTTSIERKSEKVGNLGVSIAQMKGELTDTEEALIADKEFLANLGNDCATRESEWEAVVSIRNEELAAIADAIRVLNDDDALELFKKTLPSASLLQVQQGSKNLIARALIALSKISTSAPQRTRLDFISLALRGRKIGFGKVIGMIEDMVKTLKKEQVDDENKREYCGKQLDDADDRKKGLEKSLSDTEATIESSKDAIAALADETAALVKSIAELDASVAEATTQRRQEHEEFTALMASDSAAKEVLGFAKNRLNKFYNPRLYKAPPKVELSAEDRIAVSMGGTAPPTPAPGGIAGTGIAVLAQVSVHEQQIEAPPPPPEAVGAYKKKSGESSGVLAMIDLLVRDLDKEMTEATTAEKDAQSDYEQLMSDSASKRAADSALHTQKMVAKASLEGDLQTSKDTASSITKELGATVKYIQSLHSECDWLLQYFQARKEARDNEIDALNNAKAVLSGASYSLL